MSTYRRLASRNDAYLRHLSASFGVTLTTSLLAPLNGVYLATLVVLYTIYIIRLTLHVIVRFEGRLLHFTTLNVRFGGRLLGRHDGRLYTINNLEAVRRDHLSSNNDVLKLLIRRTRQWGCPRTRPRIPDWPRWPLPIRRGPVQLDDPIRR